MAVSANWVHFLGVAYYLESVFGALIFGNSHMGFTRLLSGILFYFSGYWAPMILPLSPKRKTLFPAVSEQPSIAGEFKSSGCR